MTNPTLTAMQAAQWSIGNGYAGINPNSGSLYPQAVTNIPQAVTGLSQPVSQLSQPLAFHKIRSKWPPIFEIQGIIIIIVVVVIL